MHNFTPSTVPEEMVPTATPSEVTAQEVRDFLNGRAFMFTDQEIANILALPLTADDMRITVNNQLRIKSKKLPTVFRLATPEERSLIRKGDQSAGYIINSYTNPESVTVTDIPEHDVKIWSHGQTALLAIYQNLLNKLNTSHNGANSLIENAIGAIRHGQFSDRCQNNIDTIVNDGRFNTSKIVKCSKIIPLQSFVENPLIAQCGHCYE